MKLKHCFQRFAAALACLMLCVLCMPGAAYAAGYHQLSEAQMAQNSTLTLKYELPGVKFQVYKVASMDRDVRFTPTADFQDCASWVKDGAFVQVDTEGLASSLVSFMADKTLAPAAELTTDAQNTASTELPVGLYLVVGESTMVGMDRHTPNPFLVALPNWDESTPREPVFTFDVDVTVKTTIVDTTVRLERRVLKIWDDEGYESRRPAEITVDLLENGVVRETVVLNAANNWRAAWTGLAASSSWQVQERDVPDAYRTTIELQGVTFTITNTYVTTPGPGPGPGGSDDNDPDPDPTPTPNPTPDPGTDPTPTTPPVDPGQEIGDGEVPLARPDIPLDPGQEIGDGDVPLARPDVPEDPSVEIEDPSVPLATLPQTGQLWWPVPMLAISGSGLCSFGLIRRRGGSSDDAQ